MLIFHIAMCVSLPEAINFLGIYQECHFEPFNRSHPQPPSPKKTHRCGTRGWWCTSYELGGWDCDHILWLVVTGTWILSITYISIESIAGWWFGTMEFLWLSSQLGMLSSQLTFTPSFFRGVAKNHQPVFGISSHCSIIRKTSVVIWYFQGTPPMFAAPMSSERGVGWEKRWYPLVN